MEEIRLPTRQELLDSESDLLVEDGWMDVDIGDNLLDVSKSINRPDFTLSYNGVGFAPLSSIHAITGKKKNGKTMTETLLMVALLRGEYMGLKCELPFEPSVLFIDTEMEQDYSLMVARRVHHMCGWPYKQKNPRFNVLWLRSEESSKERWKKVLKAIYTFRPTVVFLDGIRDVIDDINDGVESYKLITKIMKTATYYGCSIWNALHENQGTDKMRGWTGTELGNKVSDTFETQKTKEPGNVYFTVRQIDARGRDVDDFIFTVKDDETKFGLPVIADSKTPAGPSLYDSFKAFMAGLMLNTRDMRAKTVSHFHINESEARDLMESAANEGILIKEQKQGSKTINWSLNKSYTPDDGSKPFDMGNDTQDAPF